MMATTDAGEGIRDPQAMAVGGVAGERDKGEGSVAATSLDDGSQGRQGSGVKEKEIGKGVGEGCVEKEEVRKQAAALERQKEGGAAAHDAEQSDTVEKGSDRRGESTADAEEGEFGGGQKLIGRKTSKKFGRRTFVGEVMSFDEEHKWYKVIYEDGDEEELEWLELKPTLQSVGQGSSLMAPTSSIEMPLGKRKRKESARLTECLNQFGSLSFTIPRTRGKNKGKGKDNPEKSESEKQSQATQEVGKETPKVVGEVAVEEKKESGKTAMVEEVVVIEENDGEDGDGTDREQKVEENVAAEDAVAVKAQPKGSGKAGAKEEAKPVNKGGLKKSTGKGKEKTVEQKVKKGEKRKDKEKDAGNGKAGEKGTKDVAVQNHAQKRQKTGEKEKQGGEKRKKPMADVQKSPAELSQKPLKKDKKSEEKSTSKPADKASAGAVAENGKEKAKKPGGEGEKSAQQVKKKQVEKPKSVSQKGGGESTVKASKTPTKGAKLEKKKAKSSDKATDVEEVAVEPRQKAGEAGEKGKAQGEKRVSPSDKAKQTQSTNKKSADKNGAQKDSKPAGKVEKAPLLSEKGHKKKDKGDGDDVNTTPETSVSKSSKGRGKKMIGEKLRKLFDGKYYNGEVVGYDPRYNYYKVKYEDGDEEELVWRELEPILIPGTSTAVKEKETVSAPAQSGKKKGQGNVTAKSKSSSPTTVEGSGEGGSSSSLKRKRAHGENGTNDNKKTEVKAKGRSSAAKREPKPKVLKTNSLASAKHTSPSNDNSAAAPATPPAMPPCPASGQQMMVRTAVSGKVSFQERNTLDYFAWGEVAQFVKGRLPPLQAAELLPVSGPIAQLAVSHHHMAAITTSGHVFVWRNRHDNIFSRTNEWEFIPDLENKDIQIVDIAGPDLCRKQSGYEPQEEDQVPDPFYLAAVDKNGQDYVLVGSQAQERPVRTMRLTEEPRYPGLKDALALTDSAAAAEVGLVIQLSVGTVEAPDESPFIGYITDRGRVYIRSATKDFMEEVNTVTGYTGKPIKIQCGRVYHAIILTDDGCAWTWGRSSFSASSPIGLGSLCDTSDSQPSLASCRIAAGTLSGHKVIDVGCYGEDFVALTADGQVHQWSYAATDQRQGVNTIPGPPHSDYLPRTSPEDRLVKVSIGVGVCAGISASGKVHTWRNGMTGCLVGMYLQFWDALTPLGRNEDGGQPADTCVSALGARVACEVKCVAGSLILGVLKKGRAKPAAKRKVETV